MGCELSFDVGVAWLSTCDVLVPLILGMVVPLIGGEKGVGRRGARRRDRRHACPPKPDRGDGRSMGR
ncbi:hypothetical protein DR62_07210 [Burkholderia thailandensis]|nr:hypothetical protein DR62_07210 [Burkholderia thailandensis]